MSDNNSMEQSVLDVTGGNDVVLKQYLKALNAMNPLVGDFTQMLKEQGYGKN
jgi:hypothetical protein